jgi:hypothetical protein
LPKNATYPTDPEQYARWLLKRLNEKAKDAYRLVFHMLDLVDVEQVHSIYERTLEIEVEGGMMTSDNKRRRTIGGVFFYLAKDMLPPEISKQIFSRAYQQRAWAMDWSDRTDRVTQIKEQGTINTMKVTLTGDPGYYVKDGTTVIVQMRDTLDYGYMNYPIGTPKADLPPVVYTIYMAEKMWKKVSKDLENPNRELHVNGVCHFDAETQTIAVLAEHVKTEKVKKPVKSDATDEKEDVKEVKQVQAEKKKPEPAPEITKPVPAIEVATPSIAPLTLPDDIPETVASKAQELHVAITKFEEKIANLKAKKQTSGLKMTERLLKNAETQLATLLKPYQ